MLSSSFIFLIRGADFWCFRTPKELCTNTKDTPNTNDSSWMLRIMTILRTHSGTVTVTTSKHQVRKKQQQNLQANFDHAQTNNSLHIASALGSFFPGFFVALLTFKRGFESPNFQKFLKRWCLDALLHSEAYVARRTLGLLDLERCRKL